MDALLLYKWLGVFIFDTFPVLESRSEYCKGNAEMEKEIEPLFEWVPGRRLMSKLEPLYFPSVDFQNSSKSKRKIGKAESVWISQVPKWSLES
jgi:hypothetical protein